ncbi:MAG: ribosome recycling factor, partial [bacterium]
MDSIIENHRPDMDKALAHFKEEMGTIRTGRANPGLVEGVLVEAYGTRTPLLQLASITTPDSRNIIVEPWDKSVIKEIEKALNNANLGLSVGNEGK